MRLQSVYVLLTLIVTLELLELLAWLWLNSIIAV